MRKSAPCLSAELAMTDDRRYRDHEIRQIMDLAIRRDEAEVLDLPGSDGLTMSELERVGQEIGLSPARMAQAVAEFEGRGAPLPPGTRLGMPTSVGHAAPLRRAPTDQDSGDSARQGRSWISFRGSRIPCHPG